MQIVQSLSSISIQTDDIALFDYFKRLFTKNFSKILGKKNKIFSFFEENEIPQRKYFLKLLEKKYHNENIKGLSQAYHKTFKLNFAQENMLKPLIFIELHFMPKALALKLSLNEKLFIAYIKAYFKGHICEYKEQNKILIIPYKDENTLKFFEDFANVNEHLRYCVDFSINEKEYEHFKKQVLKKENANWKFNALAKLFNSYFEILQCSSKDNINQIRQKYLSLVKIYHPDFYQGKNAEEMLYCREHFEKIQIAYDNLKALYKNKH